MGTGVETDNRNVSKILMKVYLHEFCLWKQSTLFQMSLIWFWQMNSKWYTVHPLMWSRNIITMKISSKNYLYQTDRLHCGGYTQHVSNNLCLSVTNVLNAIHHNADCSFEQTWWASSWTRPHCFVSRFSVMENIFEEFLPDMDMGTILVSRLEPSKQSFIPSNPWKLYMKYD